MEQIFVWLHYGLIVYTKKSILPDNIFGDRFNRNLKKFQNHGILVTHEFSTEPTELVHQQIIFTLLKQAINYFYYSYSCRCC